MSREERASGTAASGAWGPLRIRALITRAEELRVDGVALDAAEGAGTGAITRAMIEFCVPDGTVWRTVGLSTNINDASVAALGDGMIWKLQHDKVDGPKSKLS